MNTLLHIFEGKKFVDMLLDSSYEAYIDIGCNIGRLTNFVASYARPKRIIGVDPNPNCYNLCLTTQKMHPGNTTISYIQCGIGDHERDEKLQFIAGENFSGTASFSKDLSHLQSHDALSSAKSHIVTFDHLFTSNKLQEYKKFLIKIDVE